MTAPAVVEMIELLAIQVADLELALELAAVKEVIRRPAIVHVPNLPPFVSGVINFRGVAIPVIDLKSRFHAARPERKPEGEGRIPAQRLVICAVKAAPGTGATADKVVAFEVDGASEIVRVPRTTVLPAADGALRSVVSGVVPHGGRLLVWLDAPGLLSSEEKLTLDRFRMRKEDLVEPR